MELNLSQEKANLPVFPSFLSIRKFRLEEFRLGRSQFQEFFDFCQEILAEKHQKNSKEVAKRIIKVPLLSLCSSDTFFRTRQDSSKIFQQLYQGNVTSKEVAKKTLYLFADCVLLTFFPEELSGFLELIFEKLYHIRFFQ